MITSTNDAVTVIDEVKSEVEAKSQPIEEIEGAGDIEFDPFIGIIGGTPLASIKLISAELSPEKPIDQKHDNIEGVIVYREESALKSLVSDGMITKYNYIENEY